MGTLGLMLVILLEYPRKERLQDGLENQEVSAMCFFFAAEIYPQPTPHPFSPYPHSKSLLNVFFSPQDLSPPQLYML